MANPKGAPRRHSPEQVVEIVAKYKEGSSLPMLAREYGGSHVTIKNVLKREGVERRPFKNPGWRKFTAEQQAEMVRRWNAGESQTKIAKAFGTSQDVISKFLRINGHIPVARARQQQGADNPAWIGGTIQIRSGYRAVRVDPSDPIATAMQFENGYVAEHRLVMARHLGRPLRADESVHHINGDKADNRIGNLELWVTSQPRGQRVADLLAWAHEIIDRYDVTT